MTRLAVAITVVVVLLALAAGLHVADAYGERMDERNDALHDRAQAVYGDDYRVVSSAECWDLCVRTATTREQQQHDILSVLKRDGGYASEFELMANTPGSVRDTTPLDELVDTGTVERRTADDWTNHDLYRYASDPEPVAPPSDDEVRTRVRQRLYLTGAAMDAQAIANDLPAGEHRVRAALRELDAAGAVDNGYVSYGFTGQHKYIDTRIGTLPDSRFHQYGAVFPLVAIILAAVVLISVARRCRS